MWDDAVWPTVCVVTPQTGSQALDYSQLAPLRAVVKQGPPGLQAAAERRAAGAERRIISNDRRGINKLALYLYLNGLVPGGARISAGAERR
jgi:hypothetical protein